MGCLNWDLPALQKEIHSIDKQYKWHRWWLQGIRQVLVTFDTIEWISFGSTGTPPLARFFFNAVFWHGINGVKGGVPVLQKKIHYIVSRVASTCLIHCNHQRCRSHRLSKSFQFLSLLPRCIFLFQRRNFLGEKTWK